MPDLYDIPVPVPDLPYGFTLARDFTGDGRLDALLGANDFTTSSYRVSLLIALADGGYAPTWDAGYPTNSGNGGYLVRDLNHDAWPDLLVGVANRRNYLLFGDGQGGFTDGGSLVISGTPADFNGDGKLDYVYVTGGSVYVENPLPDGGYTYFTRPAYQANSSLLGDVNGDGRQDLVLLEPYRAYLGEADGGLTIGPTGTCAACPQTLRDAVLSDLNGDGRDDLIIVSGNLVVLYANSDGSLTQGFTATLGTFGAAGLVVGDLDADGHKDLVINEAVTGTSSNDLMGIFWGTAGQGFSTEDLYYNTGLGGRPSHIQDIDRDGRADVVFNGDWVVLNRGNREMRAPTLTRVAANFYADPGFVDFNGDGKLDLSLWGNGTFTIYPMGPGRKFVDTPTTCTVAARKPNETRMLSDLTGDGIPDAWTILLGSLDIYVGLGGCNFSPVATPLTNVWGPMQDLNGDHRADLVSFSNGSSHLGVSSYLATGNATFGAPVANATLPNDADAFKVEDFSGDGKADLLMRWGGATTSHVLLATGDGLGHFTAGSTYTWATGSALDVAVGDVDGDSDPDVVISVSVPGTGTLRLELLENNGSGTLTRNTNWFTHVGDGAEVTLKDLDDDGRVELIITSNRGDFIYSLAGPGAPRLRGLFQTPYNSRYADADGDGDIDIIGFDAYDSAFACVYRNRTHD